MTKLAYALTLLALLAPACVGPDEGVDDNLEDTDSKADGTTTPQVTDDQINGMWKETLDGKAQADDLVIDSWSSIGIRSGGREA